jgi:hypothetical protein
METATRHEKLLFWYLEEMGYEVVYETMEEGLHGYCYPAKKRIGLDIALLDLPIEHKCWFCHEGSHALFPPIYNTTKYHQKIYWSFDVVNRSNLKWQHAKSEEPGLIWYTEYLIPDDKFWAFGADGPREWQEWLERFEVNEETMELKIGFMRTKQWFKWRQMVKREPPDGGF